VTTTRPTGKFINSDELKHVIHLFGVTTSDASGKEALNLYMKMLAMKYEPGIDFSRMEIQPFDGQIVERID